MLTLNLFLILPQDYSNDGICSCTASCIVCVRDLNRIIMPVLDVITQVNYQVTGPIASPKVVERSRLEGEYKIPESSNL